MEDDFANLANLFVASSSLHSSLSPRAVTRRLKEVLEQLVGAEQFGVYLATHEGRTLAPIAVAGLGPMHRRSTHWRLARWATWRGPELHVSTTKRIRASAR